jgi:hypothetical protein
MPTALFMVATLVVLLTAQQSFQYTGRAAAGRAPAHLRAIFLAGRAAGAAAVCRLPAHPGAAVGLAGRRPRGKTGISDSMAPGTLSSLAQSEEVAFRVRFDRPQPAQPSCTGAASCWATTTAAPGPACAPARHAAAGSDDQRTPASRVRHEITMEASASAGWRCWNWPAPTCACRLPGARFGRDGSIHHRPGHPARALCASAYLDYRLQAGERPAHAALAGAAGRLQPAHPGAGRKLGGADAGAAQLRRRCWRASAPSATYTLEPPLLGRDAVDDFLFDSKAGFCEHYAGAFVVLMRAMGVPARVVTGYQGGEMNPVDGYLTVRQSDAHAWAEIWSRRGWVPGRPDRAVAPERVSQNLARALPQAGRRLAWAPDGLAKRSRFVAGATQIWLCGDE